MEMTPEQKSAAVLQITKELVRTKALLDAQKPLYDHLDQLTLNLRNLIGEGQEVMISDEQASTMNLVLNGNLIVIPAQVVKVVDNFATKNTAFRTAAVKRFEMASETLVEREQRMIKEAKKAAKAQAQ